MSASRSVAPMLLVALIGSAPGWSAAQTTPAAKPASAAASASSGKPGTEAPMLSRDELRACLARQGTQHDAQANLARQQQELDGEKTAIGNASDALTQEATTLDRSKPDAIKDYNNRATQLDKRVEAYNAKTAAFNAKSSEVQSQSQSYEKDCSNRRYLENDLAAIKAGK